MKLARYILIALTSILLTGCFTSCSTVPRGFPPTAAILNFDKVDNKVIRGAQFNQVGLGFLARNFSTPEKPLTVINLRQASDTWVEEAPLCKVYGVIYTNVPESGLFAPKATDMEKIMAIIKSAPGVVYLHCQHGCDRTGTAAACYQIRFNGMSNADALADAKTHSISAWLGGMKSFIKHFK